MKLKNNFFYTIREDVRDEESTSGKLLVRSGMIKKNSNSIYMYTPLGLKVIQNIENIVRNEMNKSGALEVCMPMMMPEEIYVNSGRRSIFGDNMFTLKDRYSRPYALGPTHEELFVEMAKVQIKSYKDMPFNLYQIRTKFRDETRPRYGLIRVREFTMKDAYSFDADLESGVGSYCITNTNDVSSCNFKETNLTQITETKEESGTYYAFAKDKAGNISISSEFEISDRYNSGDALELGGYNWHVISDDGSNVNYLWTYDRNNFRHFIRYIKVNSFFIGYFCYNRIY